MNTLPIPVTLAGFVTADPHITEEPVSGALRIQFALTYSPSSKRLDDAVLPCVALDAVTREDVAAILYPGAAVVVTGTLRLPGPAGDALVLEVTDLEEDGDSEDRRDSPATVVALTTDPIDLPAPLSAGSVDACTVVLCERPDGPPLHYLLTPTGACATVYSEDLVAATAAWLLRTEA